MRKWQSLGCPVEDLPLLALVKLLPLLVSPLLEVLLLLLAELPEVPLLEVPLLVVPLLEVLPEVVELWEAKLWKGLLQMKGGLMEKRLPVVVGTL